VNVLTDLEQEPALDGLGTHIGPAARFAARGADVVHPPIDQPGDGQLQVRVLGDSQVELGCVGRVG
jgi:hypothetical protein